MPRGRASPGRTSLNHRSKRRRQRAIALIEAAKAPEFNEILGAQPVGRGTAGPMPGTILRGHPWKKLGTSPSRKVWNGQPVEIFFPDVFTLNPRGD